MCFFSRGLKKISVKTTSDLRSWLILRVVFFPKPESPAGSGRDENLPSCKKCPGSTKSGVAKVILPLFDGMRKKKPWQLKKKNIPPGN